MNGWLLKFGGQHCIDYDGNIGLLLHYLGQTDRKTWVEITISETLRLRDLVASAISNARPLPGVTKGRFLVPSSEWIMDTPILQ